MNEQNFETKEFVMTEPVEAPKPPVGKAVKTMVFGIISTVFCAYPMLGGLLMLIFSAAAQAVGGELSADEVFLFRTYAVVYGFMFLAFGILALVFSIIARKQSGPIIEEFPYTAARKFAKAGRITGTIALIVSIVSLAFWGLFALISFALLAI